MSNGGTPVALVVDRRGQDAGAAPDLGVDPAQQLVVRNLEHALAALGRPGLGAVVFLSGEDSALEAAMLAEAARVVGLRFLRVDPPVRHADGTCSIPAGAAACSFDTPAVARAIASALDEHDVTRPAAQARDTVQRLRGALDSMTAQLAALEARLEVEQLSHQTGPGLPLDTLTARERQIVDVLRSGATNKEIGAQLFLSPHTVGNHLRHVYRKLDVSGRAELLGRLGGS